MHLRKYLLNRNQWSTIEVETENENYPKIRRIEKHKDMNIFLDIFVIFQNKGLSTYLPVIFS